MNNRLGTARDAVFGVMDAIMVFGASIPIIRGYSLARTVWLLSLVVGYFILREYAAGRFAPPQLWDRQGWKEYRDD